ncbi:hypothetical protein ACH42_07250 [Endozoicomonas sp. (ex Bugula neritina AB1)]|nr:hypothetical protein ACH42_07250 [Endozoicomonas sp. (ex Bugula neritina AB1)]
MVILSFLTGVLLTWLIMSGLLSQGLALLIRIWWPSSSPAREFKIDQWLRNIPEEPSSGWSLLGYWKETSKYQQACSEMAGLLADKACLSNKHKVLDMGFTSHDQLLVWLDYYQVDSLTAVVRDEELFARANDTCGHFDALNLVRGGEQALEHQPAGAFDKVLALDCVYQFNDKKMFFSNSRKLLKPGGTLAFTDMVLERPFNSRFEQRFIEYLGRISGVRAEDMLTLGDYELQLRSLGFEHIEVVDITEDVLSGFCFWFGQHYQSLSIHTRSKLWIRLRLFVWFIRWMQHKGQLRYQLIVAK